MSYTGKAVLVKRVSGTGITQRTEVNLVGVSTVPPVGHEVSEEDMLEHLYNFGKRSWYAELELKAVKVLQEHCLPISWGSFDVTQAEWRRHPYDEEFLIGELLYRETTDVRHRQRESRRSLTLPQVAGVLYGEDSDAEFAARILVQIAAL
jgi:hypothetical protein